MDATQLAATHGSPCGGPLPELEVPMINTLVRCLGSEHRRLNEYILQLALAATRLASHPSEPTANARAVEAWDKIRRELGSHLQIEDELVFSWGAARQAISPTLLDTLKVERQEMRKLMAALIELPSSEDREPESAADSGIFAQTLMGLAQNLDAHIERYDAEVLPSILRAVFRG
jgi:iron-sulfur cluster repair protein YtfE (RIC family)